MNQYIPKFIKGNVLRNISSEYQKIKIENIIRVEHLIAGEYIFYYEFKYFISFGGQLGLINREPCKDIDCLYTIDNEFKLKLLVDNL